MDRHLTGDKPHFRPEKRSINPYRVIVLLGLIMGGIWILMGIDRGDVQPLFQPTPTPTRTANTFMLLRDNVQSKLCLLALFAPWVTRVPKPVCSFLAPWLVDYSHSVHARTLPDLSAGTYIQLEHSLDYGTVCL